MSQSVRYPAYMEEEMIRPEAGEALERKVASLLRSMTLDEKMSLCHGHEEGRGSVANGGYNPGVPRLGVPEIRMYDGPAGVTSLYETTGLPVQEMLAASWDPDLAYAYGKVEGSENFAVSGNTQLGSQYDVVRMPQFVRNKDMLGEDPFLVKSLSVPETKGIQDQHVSATLKHFAMCTQNPAPMAAEDQLVDEQTFHELYLPGFEAAVTEGAATSVMGSYNKFNGAYASANTYAMQTVLRDMWNFKGYVMSDWGAVHALTTHKGTDMEMPSGAYNSNERLHLALEKGRLTEQEIDRAAGHVLYTMGMMGYLSYVTPDEDGTVPQEEGRTEPIRMRDRYEQAAAKGLLGENAKICLDVARKGAVLLKNEGNALPLTPADYTGDASVAMLGLGAVSLLSGSGQERSYGTLHRMKAPAQEVRRLAEGEANIRACRALDLFGETIPAEFLYQDEACTMPGLICTYGVSKADADTCGAAALMAKMMQQKKEKATAIGGAGVEFKGVASADNDEDSDVQNMLSMVTSGYETHMAGFETGSVRGIDPNIDFTVGSIDGAVNQTYRNASDGKAFPAGSGYTWDGYLTVPEDGEYDLILQAIGGNADLKAAIDGVHLETIGSTETREGAHWPWGNIACTPEGMDVSGSRLYLKAGQGCHIRLVVSAACAQKDMQVRLGWITPRQRTADYEAALSAAAEAKKVVLFLTTDYSCHPAGVPSDDGMMKSGSPSLEVPAVQQQLLTDVKKVMQPDAGLIVVTNSGNSFCMPWHAQADAILNVFSPGQEGGTAIAQLLLGQVNPSGKMALSIPAHDEDTLITDTPEHLKRRYLGYQGADGATCIDHDEGIFTGYRWYDQTGIEPLYPFGHGLSYTTFSYEDLKIDGRDVTFTVTNTGEVTGTEIAQVYLWAGQVPSHIQMAKKQLCGFARIEDLKPGESRTVTVTIPERSFCYWDPQAPLTERADGTKDKWQRVQGARQVFVGASSRDLILQGEICC